MFLICAGLLLCSRRASNRPKENLLMAINYSFCDTIYIIKSLEVLYAKELLPQGEPN